MTVPLLTAAGEIFNNDELEIQVLSNRCQCFFSSWSI